MKLLNGLGTRILFCVLIICLCILPIVLSVHAMEDNTQVLPVYAYDSVDEFYSLTEEQRIDGEHTYFVIGTMIPIFPIDEEGNVISDISESPQSLTFTYDDASLMALGATPEDAYNLDVYYYQDNVGYVHVGGAVDMENHAVYSSATQAGYYVLLLKQTNITTVEEIEEEETEETEEIEEELEENLDDTTENEELEENTEELDTQEETIPETSVIDENKSIKEEIKVVEPTTPTNIEDKPDVSKYTEITYNNVEEPKSQPNKLVLFFKSLDKKVIVISAIIILFVALMLLCFWQIFEKADIEGWKALIPIYNCFIFADIATGKPLFALLLFIPFVNVFGLIYLYYRLNRAFAGGTLSFILMIFVPFYVFPLIAFSSEAKYKGYDYICVYDEDE